ncbi:6063_t:CDS:2, partial [Dentiscutata erythropus]
LIHKTTHDHRYHTDTEPPLRPIAPFNYHHGIPRVITPRVLTVPQQRPVIPYVQHQRPNIPRPLQQIPIDNQLQQQLYQQFGIIPRPIPPNAAPRRPPIVPKKPKGLQLLKKK